MKVVHCKKAPYDVYCGRPSKYGNPYMIGIDGTREEVIEKYEKWLRTQPDLIEDMKNNLKGKVLGCWCKPKPCHCDVIIKIINE